MMRQRWVLFGAFALAACGGGERVVVYTPFGSDVTNWAEGAFADAHPDVELRFETVRSDSLVARLNREKDAPRASAVWGAPSWVLARLGQQGLLTDGLPARADSVPGMWDDPDGRWAASVVDPLVIAFDTDSLSRSRAPRDWIDLKHPRFGGELLLPEPGLDEGATLLLGARAVSSLREYGDILDALDWLKELDGQTPGMYLADESTLATRLARGVGRVGVIRLSAAVAGRAAEPTLDYLFPESETPLLVLGVGQVAGAPQAAGAAAFTAWLGSAEAAGGLAELGRMPARQLAGGGPSWLSTAWQAMRPQVVPADTMAADVDDWVRRWQAESKGRGARILIP